MNRAGKTTLLTQLAGEPLATESVPTMGFSIKPCSVSTATLLVKELGGAENLRPYWSMYYTGQDAIVSNPPPSLVYRYISSLLQMFVVDSATDSNGLLEATFWLENCLENSSTASLPLLVLCNKQDLEGSKSAQTVSHDIT